MNIQSVNEKSDLAISIRPVVPSLVAGKEVLDEGRLEIVFPGTGRPVSTLSEASPQTVDRAVSAARKAFRGGQWSRMDVAGRQAILRKVADLVDGNARELARLECLNTGMPIRDIYEFHVKRAAFNFRFFADYIGQCAGELYTQTPRFQTTVLRDPVGVAALIAPWNAPIALASMKIAACIAFGNSCVVKPSEQTPLAMFRLVELINEAGVPEGVVNLVNGRGPVTGEALVNHPDVDLISFTGGTETGRKIMEGAGRRLVPVTLELGGKSANIIFESADMTRALDGALIGIFSNNGQQCLAGSRILVQRSIAAEFIARFTERMGKIRIGDPFDDSTEIGPLASLAHRQRVLSYVDIARRDGCTLLGGGRDIDREGFYMEPTAVLAQSNAVRVAREEIFGPFATFLEFDSPEEAYAIANESRYGLVSYVWSDHMPTIMQATRALNTGVVWVNTPMMRELRAPFGGNNESGVGREGGDACRRFYTQEKTVTIPTEVFPLPKYGMHGS